MNTKYKELTPMEALQAKIKGEKTQRSDDGGSSWYNWAGDTINIRAMHRMVDIPWEPKKGDDILVRDINYSRWEKREFRAMVDDKYICRDILGVYIDWEECKPLSDESEPSKIVALKSENMKLKESLYWWVFKGRKCDSYSLEYEQEFNKSKELINNEIS